MDAAVGTVQVPGLAIAQIGVELQRLVLSQHAHGVNAELMQLESGKSMMRYFPPKGTAGFATRLVKA